MNATRVLHLRNALSAVSIGAGPSATYTFRNPPKFLKFAQPSSRDAHYETASLLEHLFYHQNVAPFMATRLIQRLVTSNPSPRYVLAVSTAFATGRVGDRTFSETYGDLGAALVATLLDREARSTTLDADPTHGMLREPLLKILHLMRSLEYAPKHGREVELASTSSLTGMQAYHSPTVFSFFLPEFEPDGPVASAGLVSPESELGTGPFVIGALNGLSSLIRYGLTTCDGGFGSTAQGSRGCSLGTRTIRAHADGKLSYTSSAADAATDEIVAELDLLLTSGRLHGANRAMIGRMYDEKLAQTGSTEEAMRMAQELFTLAPEFHTVCATPAPPEQLPRCRDCHLMCCYLLDGLECMFSRRPRISLSLRAPCRLLRMLYDPRHAGKAAARPRHSAVRTGRSSTSTCTAAATRSTSSSRTRAASTRAGVHTTCSPTTRPRVGQ